MLKFYEIPCEILFRRTFVLEENGARIGGGTLRYTHGVIEISDFELDDGKEIYADLLAGALLNAACNTEVARIRVPRAAHWSRFGFETVGEMLEQDREKIVFDSVCKSRGACASCEHPCEEGGER